MILPFGANRGVRREQGDTAAGRGLPRARVRGGWILWDLGLTMSFVVFEFSDDACRVASHYCVGGHVFDHDRPGAHN